MTQLSVGNCHLKYQHSNNSLYQYYWRVYYHNGYKVPSRRPCSGAILITIF